MALQIVNASVDVTALLRDALEKAFSGAEISVEQSSPGHFVLRVVSPAFGGRSRLQQQQAVFAAIAHLMKGEAAPVHAIDRMDTRPE